MRSLIFSLLAGFFLTSFASAANIQGFLDVAVGETGGNSVRSAPQMVYSINTNQGRILLTPSAAQNPIYQTLQSGTPVSISKKTTGTPQGLDFHIQNSKAGTVTENFGPTSPTDNFTVTVLGTDSSAQIARQGDNLGEQKTLVVRTILPQQNPPLPPPANPDPLIQQTFGESVQNFNGSMKDLSHGRTWITGDVVGTYKGACLDASSIFHLGDEIIKNLTQDNIDISRYSRLVIVAPPCNTMYWGTIGKTVRFIKNKVFRLSIAWMYDGASYPNMLLHEFGHNMGLNHADKLTCPDGLLSACTYVEYNDLQDIMSQAGNYFGGGGYQTFNQQTIGWLNANNLITLPTTFSGQQEFDIYQAKTDPRNRQAMSLQIPIENFSYLYGGVRAGYLTAEYWSTPTQSVSRGVVIRVVSEMAKSYWMNFPVNGVYKESRLRNPGDTFTEPTNGWTFTLISQDANKAHLRVQRTAVQVQPADSQRFVMAISQENSPNECGTVKFKTSDLLNQNFSGAFMYMAKKGSTYGSYVNDFTPPNGSNRVYTIPYPFADYTKPFSLTIGNASNTNQGYKKIVAPWSCNQPLPQINATTYATLNQPNCPLNVKIQGRNLQAYGNVQIKLMAQPNGATVSCNPVLGSDGSLGCQFTSLNANQNYALTLYRSDIGTFYQSGVAHWDCSFAPPMPEMTLDWTNTADHPCTDYKATLHTKNITPGTSVTINVASNHGANRNCSASVVADPDNGTNAGIATCSVTGFTQSDRLAISSDYLGGSDDIFWDMQYCQ